MAAARRSRRRAARRTASLPPAVRAQAAKVAAGNVKRTGTGRIKAGS